MTKVNYSPCLVFAAVTFIGVVFAIVAIVVVIIIIFIVMRLEVRTKKWTLQNMPSTDQEPGGVKITQFFPPNIDNWSEKTDIFF